MSPLPRFGRLPDERRRSILQTARQHLARDGLARASYNQIIADCGISKTSAYLYFDGKDDLVREVVRDSLRRVLDVLGAWPRARTQDAFWAQLHEAADRLAGTLVSSPDDLAVLKGTFADPSFMREGGEESAAQAWFDALLDNGVELGVVRDDLDRKLLRGATIAVFRAIDVWALDAMGRGERPDIGAGFRLVASLWTAGEEGQA